MLDLSCKRCGEEVDDFYVQKVPQRIIHMFRTDGAYCGGRLEQVFRLRPRNAEWSDRDAVVVFKYPDGRISYPGRNDKETPRNAERVVMRSLREVERFSRDHGVTAHIAGYDQGSGRAIDDDQPAPSRQAEEQRYDRFRERMRGIL